MRRAAGQVAREAHRWLQFLFGLGLLLLLATGALAWRLTEGPIALDFLARAIEARANPPDAPQRLHIGRASLGWEGWREDHPTPIDLRLSAVRVLHADGTVQAELPDAVLSLSLPWLLRGEFAPSVLELQQPVLRLTRSAEGRVALLLGEGTVEPAAAPPTPTPGGAPLDALLAALMHPPDEATPLGALARLRVAGGRLTVEDAALGTTWALEGVNIDLRRLPAGGIGLQARGEVWLGSQRVPVSATGQVAGDPAEGRLRLSVGATRVAALAAAVPGLAGLAGLDATARIDLAVTLDATAMPRQASVQLVLGPGALDLQGGQRLHFAEAQARLALEGPMAAGTPPQEATLDLRLGAGRIALGPGSEVAFAEARARLAKAGTGFAVTEAALRLAGPDAPVLTGSAEVERLDAGWRAVARLALDRVDMAGLARLWPAGIGGGARPWILQNVTAGVARNGSWEIALEAPADLATLRIAALSGTLDVAEATMHWLRPVPPAEGAQGRITFGLREIAMQVTGGRQGGVQLRDGAVRIEFLDNNTETTEVTMQLAGPVPDVMAIVTHPRLRLFDRRPMPIKDPRGSMEGRVTVSFPLLDALPVEQLRVRAQARLRDVRIPDLLLGRTLERGAFELTVDNDSLRVNGTATLAEIAARVGVEMDFRTGPANQVVMRESVSARPDARQLAALGLGAEEVLRGPVALEVRTERRRNGQGRATVRADLRDATLTLTPFGWSKPAGQIGGADAVLRLAGETLEAIESFRIEAPSLLLRGNAAFGRGTRLERVTINEGVLDSSRFAGEARPPTARGEPWHVALRGAVLDLRRALADDVPPPAAGQEPDAGPPVSLEARFERVLLGPQRELAAVEARLRVDAYGVIRDGRIAGRAGPRGPFEAQITPDGEGRRLHVTAEDAGALLGSFDVLRHLEGGRLSVNARFAHNRPGAPLAGTAEMNDFAIRNAPGFAKLLQAMTLFGLIEALSGPGLGFSRLIAPFSLTPETLTLEEARAFSASLGLTAKGTMDRRSRRMAMEGTIVPAYFFNTLLGNVPLIGRLFSPETGGGLFAATFRLIGPTDDPQVFVNPLAALTPGFLRGIFGIGQGAATP